jgi:hypothetical protein
VINKEQLMKLTSEQVHKLQRAMEKLESANSLQQSALSDYVESSDLHDRIEDILAEIEMLIEEAELETE